jgi:hypothetical protein
LTISEERRKRVIDLYYNQGKTMREIAKIERMSIRDISAIIKEEEARRQNYKDQQQQEELSSKAYKLFSKGKTPIEVAVALNLREPEVTKLYKEYCKLNRRDILNLIDKETNGKLGIFLKLYQQLVKKNGMNIAQVVNAVEIAIHKLPHMESLYKQLKDEVDKLQYIRQRLVNDIRALERKISLLDQTAFSIEQDCRRKHQEIQELIAQKYRIEKFIANILNGEGYTKMNQIAKEAVKAALSEEKKLISVSFVALIQTLKNDPQIVKLIQNIPSANDGEQCKDNDDNHISKYLELNKDAILNLTEKHYKNLVGVLTNSAIATATSSSNPTFFLPLSSATLPKISNQSDKYRIEQWESFRNSKGDIAG